MKNELLGIAFDLEGTIIDLEVEHHYAHLLAAADFGVFLSWQEAVERLPHFIGGPDGEVASEIAELAGNAISGQEIFLRKKFHFDNLLQSRANILPREGFLEVFEWIQNHNLQVIIGTVTDRSAALVLLEKSGLVSQFNENLLVAREDVTNPKPSPDVYYETARRMGIEASNQLVFEDSIVGLKAALSAGSKVAIVPTVRLEYFLKELKKNGTETIFKSWRDSNIQSFVSQLIDNA